MPVKKKHSPPFESPLEEKFFNSLISFLKHELYFIPQFEVETICKKFRLDFFINCSKCKIGFELDGPTTHNENSKIYDFWRDSIILMENHVDVIYRLSGPDLMENLDHAIIYLADKIPDCFNQKKIKQHNFSGSEDEEKEGFQIITETRKDKDRQKIYRFLLEENGGRLNPLIYKYKKQFGDYGF